MAYDAVVVGAGVNGLAAALHLAAKGWKVAVVEARDVAGGAVKTREITLPGFRHDLYAMNLGMFAGSPFFAAHKDRLIAQGLDFVGAERCFATRFRMAPGSAWKKSRGQCQPDRRDLSPADAERWRAMIGGVRSGRAAHFGLLARRCRHCGPEGRVPRVAGSRGTAWVADTSVSSSPRRANGSTRISKRQAQDNDGGLGHASRLLARYRRRRAVSLSGSDGGPSLRHGARPRRRRRRSYGAYRAIAAAGGDVLLGARCEVSPSRHGGAARRRARERRTRSTQRRAVIANLHPRELFGKLVSATLAQPAVRSGLPSCGRARRR